MVSYYVDDLYKQIYVTSSLYETAKSTGTNSDMRLGLSDLPELPGQSTWYIRSILFKAQGYQAEAGVSPDTRIQLTGGFLRRDIADVMYNVERYQDINGFPAKGVSSQSLILNNPQQNFFSFQKTWKPSENLTLNREQDISWTARNTTGNDMTFYLSLLIHAERGD